MYWITADRRPKPRYTKGIVKRVFGRSQLLVHGEGHSGRPIVSLDRKCIHGRDLSLKAQALDYVSRKNPSPSVQRARAWRILAEDNPGRNKSLLRQ